VEFKDGALLVNPYDPDSVAAAIEQAIAMPLAERKSRHNTLYGALLANDISKWGDRFLAALMGTKNFVLGAVDKPSRPSPSPPAARLT
jgi:trehalose 6-phosphate synthase